MSDTTLLVLVILPFLGMWLAAIIQVIRRQDLNTGRTAGWLVALLLVAPLALAAYVIVRPPESPRRSGTDDASDVERFVALAERRQRGEVSDDEYRSSAAALVAAARSRRAG